MELFAHHNAVHTLGMREVAAFGIVIALTIIVIKLAGAHK